MKLEIRQRFEHYTKWEDWQCGMYRNVPKEDEADLIEKAAMLLSCPTALHHSMESVTREWPVATSVNLSNMQQNRRAWLGQAACSWGFNVPEHLTRQAWNGLERFVQDEANEVAQLIIDRWTENAHWEEGKCRSGQLALTF